MLTVGLVGLPNAGKSSLFNLLTKHTVPAENFPFCTIEPSDGIIEVYDERVETLARMAKSQKTVFSAIEFRDIAGLIKGASLGAGLGNQFLSHIREVDLILLVVRCFEHDDIIHVENRVNPQEDEEILLLELTLADGETVQKAIQRLEKDMKSNKDTLAGEKITLCEQILQALSSIQPASVVQMPPQCDKELIQWRKSLNLLTDKTILRLGNCIHEGSNKPYDADISLDIALELSMADMTSEEREELGLERVSGVQKLVHMCYAKLDLCSFLTVGDIEARAWAFTRGMKASQCAGKIHSDFEKKMIKAEVISYADFIACGSRKACMEQGKVSMVGKDYIMNDGDIVEFKIGN